MDFNKVTQLLQDKDIQGDMVQRLAAFKASQQQTESTPAAAQQTRAAPKNAGGITVPALILTADEVEGVRPRTVYEFLLYKSFENLRVPSIEGEVLPNGLLQLNIHCRQKMTEIEQAEYFKELDDAGVDKNDFARKREYRQFVRDTITLESGSLIKCTYWGAALTKGPDQTFAAGDFVFITGLQPKITFDVTGQSKFGQQWDFEGLMEDMNADRDMAARCWAALSNSNHIPDLGYGGGYGPHNRTAEAIKFEQELAGKQVDNRQNWRITYNQLPQEKRGQIDKLLVVPLHRPNDQPSPADMVRPRLTHMFNPVWDNSWMGTKEDPKTKKPIYWKAASFRFKAKTFAAGAEGSTVNVSVAIASKMLDVYGITSTERWNAIAPTLVPKCGGHVVCKVDLINSVNAPENNPDMNVRKPDGSFTMGANYGAVYRANILEPNVAEGAVRAGLEINPDAVKFLLNRIYKQEDLSVNPPSFIEKWAKGNKLNAQPIKPVINVFEFCENVDKLARDGYAFFFVSKIDKDTDNSQYFIRLMAETGHSVELMSQCVMGIYDTDQLRGFVNLPVDPNEYCVFAVKRELAEEYSKQPEVLTEEQFVEQMLQAIEAQQAEQTNSNKRPAVDSGEPEAAKHAKVDEDAADDTEAYNPLDMVTD